MRLPYLTQLADDRQVRLEVELEDRAAARARRSRAWRSPPAAGSTSHLRMWYSIHSRLIVMSPSKKWKRWCSTRSPSAIGGHVHAVDLPVGVGEDALRQVVADEAVDAEDAGCVSCRSVVRSCARSARARVSALNGSGAVVSLEDRSGRRRRRRRDAHRPGAQPEARVRRSACRCGGRRGAPAIRRRRPSTVGEGARIRRCHGAHQVVDLRAPGATSRSGPSSGLRPPK